MDRAAAEEASMKIFLSSDMEGTAGVVDWEQCIGDGPEAMAGRQLLLDEVNAAIEGALADGGRGQAQRHGHRGGRHQRAGGRAPRGARGARDRRPVRLRGGHRDLLSVYRSFCAAILLTRTIAAAV
jgi:hypothetical protein